MRRLFRALLPLVVLVGCRPAGRLQKPVPWNIDPGPQVTIDQHLPIAMIGLAEAYRHTFYEAMRRTGSGVDILEVGEGEAPDLTRYKAIYLQRQSAEAALQWRDQLQAAADAGCQIVQLGSSRGRSAVELPTAPQEVQAAAGAYFAQPSVENLTRFLQYAAITYAGASGEVPAAVQYPKVGYYHPDAPGLFTLYADYLAWRRPQADRPLIAVMIPEVLYFTDNLGMVDALVHRLEQFAVCVPTYGALPGEMQPDLVIPFWPAHLVADELRLDFTKNPAQAAPILQPVRFNEGTLDDWHAGRGFRSGSKLTVWFAGPEVIGAIEPRVIGWAAPQADGGLVHEPIDERIERFARRAERWCRLRSLPNSEKRLAIVHYRQRAAYLDTRQSLVRLLTTMGHDGYDIGELPEVDTLGTWLDATDWPLGQLELQELQRKGDWFARYPVKDYLKWFETLPESVRGEVVQWWGEPPGNLMVDRDDLLIPRLKLGRITLCALPPRADPANEDAVFHSLDTPPTHLYLAFYHWLQEGLEADAVMHLGTHGTLEFLPRNNAGLTECDYSDIALGDLPNINPYMVNNPQEAITARRRGMAVTISHNVPAYAETELPPELSTLHDRIGDYLGLDPGPVRDEAEAAILRAVATIKAIPDDLKAPGPATRRIERVHHFLHQLITEVTPQGVHTLGDRPAPDEAASMAFAVVRETLLQELLPGQHEPAAEQPLRKLVERVVAGEDPATVAGGDDAVAKALAEARDYAAKLAAADEIGATLAALRGEWIPSTVGGDPVRNPETQPTGRNLHGLQPRNIPSEAAWEVGRKMAAQLLARERATKGQLPDSVAFVLFGGEAIRHHGVSEAQILWLLGVRPVWQRGGAIGDLELIPRAELGHPRIDCVITSTGQYRDVFGDSLVLLQKAVELAAAADEPDNTLRPRVEELRRKFLVSGKSREEAELLATARVFAPAEGSYGAVEEAAKRSDFGRDEAAVGDAYLDKLGHAYGRDELWGRAEKQVFSAALKGVDAAVFSRSSQLYALLDTDHPFGFLGGLSQGVVQSGGKAPELYVNNLKSRGEAGAGTETVEEFMGREAQARYFNPQWVASMQAEGHAGALQMADFAENLWGWSVTAPEQLPSGLWDRAYEVYIQDALHLDVPQFMMTADPASLAQLAGRLEEAAVRGYWQATDQQLARIRQTQMEAQQQTQSRLEQTVPGGQATEQVTGKQFEEVKPTTSTAPQAGPLVLLGVLLGAAALFVLGALRQLRYRGPR